jgi:hypothetical protein
MAETRKFVAGSMVVTGPDSDGDYEVYVPQQSDDYYTYLSREQADALIAVLQAQQPVAPK